MSLEKETLTDTDLSLAENAPSTVSSTPLSTNTTGLWSTSKTKPVILYIIIMFAVALLLIILSFFMQQRNHNALMKGLSSASLNAQTIADLKTENKEFEDALAKATEQLDSINAEIQTLKDTTATLELKVQAVECLMELRLNYASGKYSKAKEILKLMQESDLVEALPSESSLENSPSPRAEYERILSLLS